MNARLNAEQTLSGDIGAGSLVVNDYRIQADAIDGGHRLTITRGSEVQTMDLMDGSQGEPGQDAPQDVVRYAAQSLDAEQQTQARENIGAADAVTVNGLKDDLSDKLPKSPANWEQWTADEQTAARERMGIAGYELIVDVPTLETVSNFHITLDSNGNALALKAVTIDFAGATGGDNCLVEINNGYLKFIGALGKGRFGSLVGIPLGNDYYCYYFTNNAPDRNQFNPNYNQFMAGVKADTIINDIWFRGTVPAGASIQIYGIRG